MKNVVKLRVPRGSKIRIKQTTNNIASARPKLKSKTKKA